MKAIFRWFFLITIFITATLCGAAFYIATHYTIDLGPLAHYNPGHPSIVLDDAGKEWARFSLDKRDPICLDKMPTHLQQAFIAAEDWQFFNHKGISWKGIFRSTIVNLASGKKMQGASTITQQLVKLLFFDSQKTFRRKIKEQLYAVLVERQFTKEQILEIYLNHIYFGCGIYGVEAASQRFWAKSATSLSIAESATLAAIISSPGHYCPLLNPVSAQRRRNIILLSMKKLHLITDQEYEQAVATELLVQKNELQQEAPHVKEYIRIFLEQEIGKKRLYTGGLLIQTTLNSTLQQQAQKSFYQSITRLKESMTKDIDGALVSMDVATGGIKAMVGGYDFTQSKFNRATQARRQIGSVFKPLLYAAAVQKGISFSHVEVDQPLTIEQPHGVWQPNNYDNNFEGPMSLARALLRSNNIIAVKTLLHVGSEPVVALAKACGLGSSIHSYPSLALGCIDATLLQVTGMFNIFANHGKYIQPYLIEWVKDSWGSKIWKHTHYSNVVLPAVVTDTVSKVLELGIKRWRSYYGQEFIKSAVIQKTGTTNDARTCWYAGSTPELTTVVYVGTDDNKPLGPSAYPVKTAFPIWLGLYENRELIDTAFVYDARLKPTLINEWSGKVTTIHDPEAIEIFI